MSRSCIRAVALVANQWTSSPSSSRLEFRTAKSPVIRIQSKSSSESPVQMVLRVVVGWVDDKDDVGEEEEEEEEDCCEGSSCRGYDGDDGGWERRLLLLREISFQGSRISY